MNQLELFKQIREERDHICAVCGSGVNEPMVYCFAHMIPKGMSSKLKLEPLNLQLVCSIECHEKLDKMIKGKDAEIRECIKNNVLYSL